MRHRRRQDPYEKWVPFTYGVALGSLVSFGYILAMRAAQASSQTVFECFLPVNV